MRVKFTASRISELLAEGTGKTRMNYIFDLAAESLGHKKDILTKAMSHGIQNEIYAMNILISNVGGSLNVNDEGDQSSFDVNDKISATPDGYKLGSHTLESKCQYSIKNFFEQNDRLPTKYFLQVQTQMMALKVDQGYLINYLTKPEMFGQDDWQEYPIPLEKRYHIHEIQKDEAFCEAILSAAEKYYPFIGTCIEMLSDAFILSHDDFFGMQFYDKARFTRLKDIAWINNDRQVYFHDEDFYVIVQKK